MTTCLWSAVELLERSVAYTRGRLANVAAAHPSAPTPCSGWDLATLLFHMDDALSAFIEGSREVVSMSATDLPVTPPPIAGGVGPQLIVASLHGKACVLLGAWSDPTVADRSHEVRIGNRHLDRWRLAAAGALEIAVHGWDVGVSTGHARPLPEGLAAELLDCADELVSPADRPTRFAPALPCPDTAAPSTRLLALLGRAD